MSAIEGRKAHPNRSLGDERVRIKRSAGFTLLEVAIAGAILMGGLAILAQLVRTTLSTSTPGFTEGAQVGPVVEQQMKLLGAYIKGYIKGRDTDINRVQLGAVHIYSSGKTRDYILPMTPGYGGRSYGLIDQEITAKVTLTSDPTPSMSDPLVGYTRFWKLEVSPIGTERAGL